MSDNCSPTYPQSIRSAMSATTASGPIDQAFGSASSLRRRRSRRRQQHKFEFPSKFLLLALCFAVAANFCTRSDAFSSPAAPSHSITTSRIRFSSSSSSSSSSSHFFSNNNNINNNGARQGRTRCSMSAVAEPPKAAEPSRITDFQRRMKGLVNRNGRGGAVSGRRTMGQRAIDKPKNLRTVSSLEEYKEVMDEEHGKIIVVRFFATWCKACKAIQPSYYRMASLYPHIVFLEVPVTNDNSNLHQGLDVPSLPYGHIYYPEAGLVEELKISKKYFHNLVKMIRWYDGGQCGLDEYVPPPVLENDTA